jgi:exopolyphosphatase/guanosine-5'-triphosphate,3'-diphosphate pyrophosphatase
MESLPIGCLSYNLHFFPENKIDAASMQKAILAASAEIEVMAAKYRALGWKQVVLSSGTAKSIANILSAMGWCEAGISALGLERLRAHVIKAGSIQKAGLNGVRADRLEILAGGVAAMSAIFGMFELHYADVSDASLRQGLLHDLLARAQLQDPRAKTVQQLGARYRIDTVQAERVTSLTLALYDGLTAPTQTNERSLLQWAAQLHEIGLSIAQAAYHKHSAYILSNADMPGFSRDEQTRLAHIVLGHRGKLSKLRGLSRYECDWASIFSLRIAALFHRSRTPICVPHIACAAGTGGFELWLPSGWLEAQPLIAVALEAEQQAWHAVGFEFKIGEVRSPHSAKA